MNVYYSNMDQLSFQNNNSGGVDYTLLKSKLSNFKQKSGYQSEFSKSSLFSDDSFRKDTYY
jgi:hypothetical protein